MRRIVRRAVGGAILMAALCATEASGNEVTGFALIDADTQEPIQILDDGDVIDAAQLPRQVNLQAITEPRLVGSVRFDLNDQVNQRTDNMIPFALGGESLGLDGPMWLPPGEHTLTASPFTRSNGMGIKGQTLAIHFTVVGHVGVAPPVPTPTMDEVLADAQAPIAVEQSGMVVMEIESHPAIDGWIVADDLPDTLGAAYVWTGPYQFEAPGLGVMTYLFDIRQAGDYELRWRNKISAGDDNTEHNDSWFRFLTGQNTPEELPIEGWTKVYQNQLGRWGWQTSTFDHDPHSIRRRLEAGRHAIQVAGRSQGHAIDRIVLFKYDEIAFDAETFDQAPSSETLILDPPAQTPQEEESKVTKGQDEGQDTASETDEAEQEDERQ